MDPIITEEVIAEQKKLDLELVPSKHHRLLTSNNYVLPKKLQDSKHALLHAAADMIHNCPFSNAFTISAEVPEVYMQQFWHTVRIVNNTLVFTIDTEQLYIDLEIFREIFKISTETDEFESPPSEDELV